MVETQASVINPPAFGVQASHKKPGRVWLWFNLLSLDAPLVALVWQCLFAHCYGVELHWPGIVSLGISVWLIYVFDRLLDLRGAPPSTARHVFTRRHRRLLSRLALAVLPVLLWASLHLASVVIRNGLLMSCGVVVYFLVVHAGAPRVRLLWPKELAVGVIFALGTSLVVWSRMTADRRELIGPAVLFAALCWLNCVAIEHWEWKRLDAEYRLRCQQKAEPHLWTLWVGRHMLEAAFAVAVAALFLLPSDSSRPMVIAAAVSASGLAWLERQSRVLSLDALRVLADVAMLSPTLLLLLNR